MGFVERQISELVNVLEMVDVEMVVVDVVEMVVVDVVEVVVIVVGIGVAVLSVTIFAVRQVPWSEGQNSPTQMSAQPLNVS